MPFFLQSSLRAAAFITCTSLITIAQVLVITITITVIQPSLRATAFITYTSLITVAQVLAITIITVFQPSLRATAFITYNLLYFSGNCLDNFSRELFLQPKGLTIAFKEICMKQICCADRVELNWLQNWNNLCSIVNFIVTYIMKIY